MVNRPDIIVADEPCASPDSESPKMVPFKESNEEMKQVIITVSLEDRYTDYIHRIIRLWEGRYRATDSNGKSKASLRVAAATLTFFLIRFKGMNKN